MKNHAQLVRLGVALVLPFLALGHGFALRLAAAEPEPDPARQEAIAKEHAPSAQASKQELSSEQKPAEQSPNTARHVKGVKP
jgi:predicted lipid-binding transport protein (Tim44 family)